jgi:hypothetical protein
MSKSPHFEQHEFSDFPSAEDTYAGWLHMAEDLIFRYEGVGVGATITGYRQTNARQIQVLDLITSVW